MTDWNAARYLKFAQDRNRPTTDLIARIPLTAPARIVDLGCGPGNSTQQLQQRWPDADLTGIDSSPEMLTAARQQHFTCRWIEADISQWKDSAPFDLVFSNAAIQWIPDHAALLPHLCSLVRSGGSLAIQMPNGRDAAIRQHVVEISHDSRWTDCMHNARRALTMESSGFYYDVLAPAVQTLDLWETEYSHVLPNSEALVEWVSGTGLRPYLEVLTPVEQTQFLDQLRERVTVSYPVRADGQVVFPFRRLFMVATC